MEIDNFINEIEKLGLNLSQKQLNQLQRYYELILEYNKVMNLTGITEQNQVYLKHFYDSLTILKVIDLNNINSLCDIGTGAGFPGIVLKIAFPNLNVTLVDSLNKRIEFLKHVIKELNLEKISAIHSRAEDFAKNNIEKFDVVTCRAVANLRILLEYSIPMLKIGGFFIPLKAEITDELEQSKNAQEKLNVIIEQEEKFFLPVENSKRTILKYKKVSRTSKLFPRKYSDIKKKPL